MQDFEIGQRVSLERNRIVSKILEVTAKNKRFLTLSDGSKWKLEGFKPYGNQDSWYIGPTLRLYREGDDENQRHHAAMSLLSRFQGWDYMSQEEISSMFAVLESYYKRKDQEKK